MLVEEKMYCMLCVEDHVDSIFITVEIFPL